MSRYVSFLALTGALIVMMVFYISGSNFGSLGHLEMYKWCPHFTTGFTFASVGQYLTGTDSHFFFSFFSFPTSLMSV